MHEYMVWRLVYPGLIQGQMSGFVKKDKGRPERNWLENVTMENKHGFNMHSQNAHSNY